MFWGGQKIPLLGILSASCGPYIYAAGYCDELCMCVKFLTRLSLENRSHLVLHVLPVPVFNIGTEDGAISNAKGKKELCKGR